MEDVPGALAQNLRQLRLARGLTQEQLAKVSGVPRPTWAHLESGAGNPTLAVLMRVAGALQVSIEELISPPKATAKLYKRDT
ncbi:MAG: helix-turn-helix domain-containing protein, partial [Polyangiales bacterium]